MNIRQTAWDETIRAESIIWLACQADQYTEELRDFFTDGSQNAKELTEMFGVKFEDEELEEAYEARRGMDDYIQDFLHRIEQSGKEGFLIKAATPIPQSFHEDGGITYYGFGCYTTKWFYADSLDGALIERLVAWKSEVTERERRQHEAERKADALNSVLNEPGSDKLTPEGSA